MKKKILLFGTGFVFSVGSFAQNDIDAMRYSQLTFGGTARFASMGGSMSALGGDISCLSFNPAGIAVFKKTEISFTPSLFSESTTSTYLNNSSNDRKFNVNLGNIGIVASFKLKENNTGWQSLNFGFGYNRTNNFNTRVTTEAYNTKSSLLDLFVANANGHYNTEFDGFSTGLAWTTYLINPTTDTLHYDHVIKNYGELQRRSLDTKGSMGETVITFGGNYKDKVLLGGTIGIVTAKYTEESNFEELDQKDTINGFKSFAFHQSVSSVGRGFNCKLGLIVKPNDWLRIGAAIHTPTGLSFRDTYSSSMESNLDNNGSYSDSSKNGSYNYTITTPYRILGSLGFIIKKIGLLNVEYEYLDYSYASLNSRDGAFSEVNKTIRSKYTSTGNLRVGGEVRFDPLSFRLGYALYGSPFNNGDNVIAHRSSYTGGIGFRENNYFIDLAYVLTKYTEYNYLYDPSLSTPVKNEYSNSSFMLTFGVRF